MAYESLEPFGERIAWERSGTIAAVMANAFRGSNSQAFKPSDFMPREPGVPKKQSLVEQKAILMALAGCGEKAGILVKK